MTEAEAFRRLEETCSFGHGNRVTKRRDCMTCQVLLLVEATTELECERNTKAAYVDRLLQKLAALKAENARLKSLLASASQTIRASLQQPNGEHRRQHRLSLLEEISSALSPAPPASAPAWRNDSRCSRCAGELTVPAPPCSWCSETSTAMAPVCNAHAVAPDPVRDALDRVAEAADRHHDSCPMARDLAAALDALDAARGAK